MSSAAAWSELAPGGSLREARRFSAALLRMYAGILFSSSLSVGALVLLATALVPLSGLLGLLAIGSATATAQVLGLVSEGRPQSEYAYSALFLGLGASHTFAAPEAALALATLGAMLSVIATAALGGWLHRVGLPTLSLPFVLVYSCALSVGSGLGAAWAEPVPCLGLNALRWPAAARMFLEALGAMFFTPRLDVGLVVFASLCLCGGRVPQLALLAFGMTELVDFALSLHHSGLWLSALINATFSAMALGGPASPVSPWLYMRAAFAIALSLLLTVALSGPLGRLGLGPVSLPFNLSVFILLLVGRQRADARRLPQRPARPDNHARPGERPHRLDVPNARLLPAADAPRGLKAKEWS
jgi:urea transporter